MLCREHDDRCVGRLADLTANLVAVNAGQHEIEEHQVRLELLKLLHGLLAVPDDARVKTLLRQIQRDQLRDVQHGSCLPARRSESSLCR